ncbi:PREDICTED: uncharacterized protein LOC105565383 [Vollenhovia emeryi]|uniref:uncharacterized protein LOC105565383 n=1 Tax=Vollenhovia emeryi TaxID=411798 RepID=UPI0005F3B40E|nr:PREDICTED: uncharacterized protein LOC105565383 [Vollenhovia emeryi]
MCTFSPYSRNAMLRRQYDPVDVVRGLLNPKPHRNLSAASVMHTDEKTVGGRDGFLTWLKDIFNKSAEDKSKSRKADTVIVDRAATATTFNRPEIATSMRPADPSDKVDVINQKLANFYAVRSTTKFEYGNIRGEKRDAESGERAYATQQSAIYATSQPSRFAAGKTSEREMDPGKVYRSEKNGGAIEFAARVDLDVASHYRCYTSPRHCYRLPPQRTKQPLLGLCVPNRYISMPTRAIVGFAPRDSKPPIKEPDAPEKREKKDEKKNRKDKKKPVIHADGESVSVDSSENRAEMVANDNPRSDPDAAFRYEWGVKLAEEQPAVEAANDNDKLAEKGQRYVTKRLWGVNLKQPEPDTAPPATANSGRGAEKPQNASSTLESGDTTDGAKGGAGTAPNDSPNKSDVSSLKGTTAEYLSTPSSQTGPSDNLVATQQDSHDASSYMSSEELRKIMRTSPNMLKETIVVDNEFNIPEEAGLDTEITAWRNLVTRSVPEVKENYSSADTENLEMVSIRPEAPQPKLDVRVVRSTEDNLKNKEIEQLDSRYTSPKTTEIKRVGSLRRPDLYSNSKKLHTMSAQIRYIHRRTNSIQHSESLSSNFASVDRTKMKCPGFVSAFSTNSEGSMPKKVIDGASSQQSKQQRDSKNQNEGNDPNSNNILSSNPSPMLVKSRTSSSSDQQETDTDFAKVLDVIADKEMEISINQLQSTGRKKTARLSDSVVSSEFTQKDKSRSKDEIAQDEIKHYIDSHDEDATYVDFNNPSTDSDSIKSDAIKSAKGDSGPTDNSATLDSNVKNVGDDPSKEYIIDGDYIRLPGDPYPYSKENLDKWRVPRSKNLIYKSWKQPETSCSSDSPTVARSTLRNANDAYANAAGEPRDSHAGNAVMETSGSGGDSGANARKRTGQVSGFHVSSRDQRVVSDYLRGDAADALGLRQWTEVFSRLDVGEKINEAARSGDNAPFRARYE